MHSIDMLLCKDHSSDPPTTAVSAPLPLNGIPSTSNDTLATLSAQASRDGGPPPSKRRRQSALIVSASMRSGVPLSAGQVSTSTKVARRVRAEPASKSSGATGSYQPLQSSAPFADQTNQPVFQVVARAYPRRAGVKPPIVDLTDSASDEESSSSSDFEPDDEHVSEDDADVGKLSDFEADDLNVSVTPPSICESSAQCCVAQINSSQITVFKCDAPSLICCETLPGLKLFHELSDAEREEFLQGPDGFRSFCTFCKESCSKRELDHFFGICYACTWPGCTVSYQSSTELFWHYAVAHDPSFSDLKCDRCNYVGTSRKILNAHKKRPHPKTEAEALNTSTDRGQFGLVRWKEPRYCDKCGIYYAEFDWSMHKRSHESERRKFDPTLPVQGVQLSGLRDSKCPFDGCDEPYRDFTGWYLHCKEKHTKYMPTTGGHVPVSLESRDRARMPMFRCTSCMVAVPLGHLYRHQSQCIGSWTLAETVGTLVKQRAAAYGLEPGLLRLEYGAHVVEERVLMGALREATDSAQGHYETEKSLCEIRRDPFLHSFVKRNLGAPEDYALYTVAKMPSSVVPEFSTWVKDLIVYAGSSIGIGSRVSNHIRDSMSKWHEQGLMLEEGYELYLFRMSITVDEETSVASFNDPDLKRLEQLLVDALGLGTLFNVHQVMSVGAMLNDPTYRNHIAPRLNQLALVLFESTYAKLIKNGNFLAPDSRNVWHLPIVRKELNNIIRMPPKRVPVASTEPTNASLGEATTSGFGVDQACSPIPAPRVLTPEVHDVLTRYANQYDWTKNQVLDRLREQWTSTSAHTDALDTGNTPMTAGQSGQSDLLDVDYKKGVPTPVKESIVRAVRGGMGYREVAKVFKVSKQLVCKWVNRMEQYNTVKRRRRKGRPKKTIRTEDRRHKRVLSADANVTAKVLLDKVRQDVEMGPTSGPVLRPNEQLNATRAGSTVYRSAKTLGAADRLVPEGGSLPSGVTNQRSVTSPDLFGDDYSYSDEGVLDDVPSTSNGPDFRALEELRASCVAAATSHRTDHQESDESHMPAGEIVQSGAPRQPTPRPFHRSSRSEVSASQIASVKEASGSVPPTMIRQCTLRIPSYGGLSTQYVDLSREPVDLSQDTPSEASLDEPQRELSDESSESSDEEPPREILDDSSESSLDEPSPTDSGFFDFDNVPITGPELLSANDSVKEATPKDSAQNVRAALRSDDVDEEEADLDTNDKCAHENCCRPQYKNINWVQCDDCDEWYHNLCILGEEIAFEETEFHCECAQNGKRKPTRAQRSKKQ